MDIERITVRPVYDADDNRIGRGSGRAASSCRRIARCFELLLASNAGRATAHRRSPTPTHATLSEVQ
jgi:hypothetical protein